MPAATTATTTGTPIAAPVASVPHGSSISLQDAVKAVSGLVPQASQAGLFKATGSAQYIVEAVPAEYALVKDSSDGKIYLTRFVESDDTVITLKDLDATAGAIGIINQVGMTNLAQRGIRVEVTVLTAAQIDTPAHLIGTP